MKALLMSLTLFCSLLVQAAGGVPGYRPVPSEKVESYKTAVRYALQENMNLTGACDSHWVQTTIQNTYQVLVNKSHAQPLLVFNAYYNNGWDLHRLVFTTSADLRKIAHVHYEILKLGEVNNGDLANPVIVQDYILQTEGSCQQAY